MLLIGQITGILEDTIAGTAFVILGVIMYRLLYVLSGKRAEGS